MLFKIPKKLKEVQLSTTYVRLRNLTPVDKFALLEVIKEKAGDEEFVDNAMIAFSIVEVVRPNIEVYGDDLEDYLIEDGDNFIVDEFGKKIVDDTNEDNWIKNKKGEKDKLKPYGECTYLVDPREPKIFKLNKEKAVTDKVAFPTKIEDILNIMRSFDLKDWALLVKEVYLQNRPNPFMLGK